MIIWAHGLWGNPNGSKVTAIRDSGIKINSPDFNGRELGERVELLDNLVSNEDVTLVGSSYGGLACALVAQKYPENVNGMLLLAPALHIPESPNDKPEELIAPSNFPVTIIHSFTDEIVPISASKDYIKRSGKNLKLIEVEDSHVLENSFSVIISELNKLVD